MWRPYIIEKVIISLNKYEKRLYGKELFNKWKEWLSIEKGGAIALENEMILSVAYLMYDI